MDHAQRYLEHLQFERGLSTLTVQQYRRDLDLLLELTDTDKLGSLEKCPKNSVLLWSRKTRQQLGVAQLDATLSERSANCVRGVHQAQAFVEGGPTPTKAPCRIVPIAL